MEPCSAPVIVVRVNNAKFEQIESVMKSRNQQCWLWSVIEHRMGEILAYVLVSHKATEQIKLKQLLAQLRITHYYTDGGGAYLGLLE